MKQNMLIRFAVIALALFLGAGLTQTALAQWSNDPNVSATICTPALDRPMLATVNNGSGGLIAAWYDPSNPDAWVLAQNLGSDGRRLWQPGGNPVAHSAAWKNKLHLVSDQAGGAIISAEGLVYGWSVTTLQRINSSGQPLWGSEGIRSLWYFYGVASDGLSGAIIVGIDQTDGRLIARRYNAAGAEVWTRSVIEPVTTYNRPLPKIISDGSGGAVIVWQDYRGGSYDQADIYAQRISPTGVVQWAASGVPIVVVPGDQSEPLLVPDGTGGAFITWNDERVSDKNVYAQRINGAGIVQWAVNGINVSSAINASYINRRSIVSDGSGGALVAWSQWKSCGGMVGCAQRLSASGTLLWPVGGIDLTGCEAYAAEIIHDGAGGFIAVWDQIRGVNFDVYSQRFSMTGARLWTSTGVPVSTNQFDDVHATPVLDGRGGVIVPWTLENPAGVGQALYAQRLNLDGTLGQPNMIANGGFEQGLGQWSGGGCVTPSILYPGCNSASAAKVLINGQNCSAQFYQHGFAIERGKRYRVSFNAWSSRGEDMQLTVLPHNASTFNIGLDRRVDVATSPCTNYSFEFLATGNTNDARLRFMFNYMSTTGYWYCFDNVSIQNVLAKEGVIAELVPTDFRLEQNYPNPFNPTTIIKFQIPNDGHVSLKVFDVLGQEARSLVNESRAAGVYEEVFAANTLSSGVYIYRMQGEGFTDVKKMMVLK